VALIVVVIVAIASLGSAYVLLESKEMPDYEILPNKYAVVVGISNYPGFASDLSYCDDDARSWELYLRSKGYDVRTLIDSRATRDAILSNIEWMESMEQEGASCAFIFSGHGGYAYSSGSYIYPYDAGDFTHDADISDDELAGAFENFESEHIFFFFDSCSSGGLDGVAGDGRYVSQSSAQNENSYEYPSQRNGIWTYWFLEWGLDNQGYQDVSMCYDNAYLNAVQTSNRFYEGMHPEEEYSGSEPFYL
jgi:hypothetical protein